MKGARTSLRSQGELGIFRGGVRNWFLYSHPVFRFENSSHLSGIHESTPTPEGLSKHVGCDRPFSTTVLLVSRTEKTVRTVSCSSGMVAPYRAKASPGQVRRARCRTHLVSIDHADARIEPWLSSFAWRPLSCVK
jgi:hypothetical protein